MVNTKNDKAICPYYESCHDRSAWECRYIRCAGISKGTFIQHVFPSKAERDKFFDEHCATYDYADCPVAEMYERMYDDSMEDRR